MRNALAHVPRGQHTVVAAIRQAFIQPDRKSAGETWRQVADQLRPRRPKLAAPMDGEGIPATGPKECPNEHDVLACMSFPAQHRARLHSTNPLERLNKEVERRTEVVGIFANEAAVIRLAGLPHRPRTGGGTMARPARAER